MNGIVHGLTCFPKIENKILTWGSELNLYELKTSKSTTIEHDQQSNHNRIHKNDVNAEFLISENKYQYVRCVKSSYYDDKPIVAVGMSNGKVGICDFQLNSNNNGIDNEFIPRQQRPCLCLAWNEYDKNMLAIGHDRNRSDYGITIWDTKRGNCKEAFNYIGLSDTVHSLCWDKENRTLIAGINQKSIRQFDLRQSNVTTISNNMTRLVHGLTISSNGQYIASYLDTYIGIWDLRNIERPLTQISIQKNITNISWCTTRSYVLSAIQRGSQYLHIINIYNVDIDGGHDICFTKKNYIPFNNMKAISYANAAAAGATGAGASSSSNTIINNKINTIADIAWHPNVLDQVLILMESGNLSNFAIPPRISISWNTNKNLWLSTMDLQSPISTLLKFSKTNPQSIITDDYTTTAVSRDQSKNIINIFEDDDIAEVTKKRAIIDYGLIADISKNGDLAQNCKLKSVWKMLANMYDEENMIGLKTVLGIENNHLSENFWNLRSEIQTLSWPDFIKNSNILLSYRNESRTRAQILCGWNFDNDMNILQNKFLPELCNKKEYTRAAMIAVFYLKIHQACEILLKGTDQTNDPSILRMAAIALSGFDADHTSLIWKQKQALASSQIRDPYIKMIFSFLTIENDNFDVILMEKGIALPDRVAFACKYLSDMKLIEFIQITIQKCIKDGDLNGLLLTGELNESVQLMQAYMNRYQDVQTVSLLVIRFFHLNDVCVQSWITTYLDLLDTWGLWEKRAELENKMNYRNNNTSVKSSRSVFLLCNFCGKSISSALAEDARMRNVSSNVNKLSSCPNCRKPLPRCSLCLLHMGTTTAILSQNSSDHESLGWQSKPFSKWFSWCQTCRHGGHTEHLQHWFQKNTECPVTGCSCKCYDMDLSVPKFHKDIL